VALWSRCGKSQGRYSAPDRREHAATQDPMVLAWSHVYLARIYDDEGNPEVARMEYQSGAERGRRAGAGQAGGAKGAPVFAGDKPIARP